MNLNDGRSFGVPTEEVEISIRGGNFMTIHNSSCWRITEGGKPKEVGTEQPAGQPEQVGKRRQCARSSCVVAPPG